MRDTFWWIGGLVVVGGLIVGLVAHRPVHSTATPRLSVPVQASKPAPAPNPAARPKAATPPPSSVASYTAATGQAPAMPLAIVRLPWNPQTQWAVEPVGVTKTGTTNPTLWFGVKAGHRPWRWIPVTLPGALSPQLPPPVHDALALAYDLNQREPGPATLGPIQWAELAGAVGLPVGWTLQTVPAADSPLVAPSVVLTVWLPSDTGSFTGLYGLKTVWDRQNAPSGQHGFAGFVAAPGPMAAVALHPPE